MTLYNGDAIPPPWPEERQHGSDMVDTTDEHPWAPYGNPRTGPSRVPGIPLGVICNAETGRFEVWSDISRAGGQNWAMYIGAHDKHADAYDVAVWLLLHASACADDLGRCQGFERVLDETGEANGIAHHHLVRCALGCDHLREVQVCWKGEPPLAQPGPFTQIEQGQLDRIYDPALVN